MMIRRVLTASLTCLLLAACPEVQWGDGRLADELPTASIDPAGLVVVVAASDVDLVGAQLVDLVAEGWSQGLTLEGSVEVTLATGARAEWAYDGVLVNVGHPSLAFAEGGVEVTVWVEVPPTPLQPTVSATGLTSCAPIFRVHGGPLTFVMSLSSDKVGRVVAAITGAAALPPGDVVLDWSACADDAIPYADEEGMEGALRELLARSLSGRLDLTLGADLVSTLPRALGLQLAAGLGTPVARSGIGAGFLRLSVGARGDATRPVWRIEEGRLEVPFEVGIEAGRHPCMPDLPLEAVRQQTPPAVQTSAVLISGSVLRRSLGAAWRAGLVCGGQGLERVTLDARGLATYWPALARLAPTATLGVELWPKGMPTATIEETAVRVDTGPALVDLYGEIDGAMVRLTSISLEASLTLALAVTPEGRLEASLERAEVQIRASRPGLLAGPSPAAARAIVALLAARAIEGAELLRIPTPLGATGITAIRGVGDYLVITPGPAR